MQFMEHDVMQSTTQNICRIFFAFDCLILNNNLKILYLHINLITATFADSMAAKPG